MHHHHRSGDDSKKKLLPENPSQPDPHNDKTYALLITPNRLRSQLLVNNLKASGILPYQADDDDDYATGRPAQQLKHSARGLEAIGFDENASMYSSYKGDGGWEGKRNGDGDGSGKEKKEGGKRRNFLKKLVGRGEEKGEKL